VSNRIFAVARQRTLLLKTFLAKAKTSTKTCLSLTFAVLPTDTLAGWLCDLTALPIHSLRYRASIIQVDIDDKVYSILLV